MMMKGRFRTHREIGIAGPVAAAVFLVVALAFFFRFDAALRDVFFTLSAPGTANPEYALLSRDALVARLADAERELKRVRYANVVADLMADENQKLRTVLNAAPQVSAVTARVLARPSKTRYDSLVIDAGLGSGITAGDLVVAGSAALGRVESVGASTALVELFSNPGAERDVLIGNPQSVAIVRGLGGGAFELAVPQELSVAVGDMVRIPASASYALGIVVEITSKPTDTSKIVRIAAPVSMSDLDFVSVIPRAP